MPVRTRLGQSRGHLYRSPEAKQAAPSGRGILLEPKVGSLHAGMPENPRMPHAVSHLRSARLARSAKPFLARGGFKRERCVACRLVPSHCMCILRPSLNTRAGVCLLMADIEPLKPTNTGWL